MSKRSKAVHRGRVRPPEAKRPKADQKVLKKVIDSRPAIEVRSSQSQPEAIPQPAAKVEQPAEQPGRRTMTLTYKGLSKNQKNAFYTGAVTVLRFSLSAFPDKRAPHTIEVADGAFAAARQPKAKLTKEQRAALPKPTLAEKVAAAQKRAATLAAKLAASQHASM